MTCYATARVTFYTDALREEQANLLADVPGVHPWEGGGRRWTAPYTAAWIAADILRREGVDFAVSSPPVGKSTDPVTDEARAALTRSALEAGVHGWVFDGFVRPFQVECAAFAWLRERAHVWAEPGSGKTLVGIMAAATRKAPVLVVCPSPVVRQYADEIRRFTSWSVLEYRAPSQRRVRDLPLEDYVGSQQGQGLRPVVVVGWDLLREHHEELLYNLRRPYVIFDEAQRAKGRDRLAWSVGEDGALTATEQQNTTMAAYKIAKAASGVLCTTATAISNALIDLWGQLTLVEPTAWGRTAKRFSLRYAGGYQGEYGWVWDGETRENREELQQRLAWSVIRIPYEVSHGQLPPKRRMMVRVAVEDQVSEQSGFGRELRAAQKAAAEGGEEAGRRSLELQVARAASRKRKAIVDTLRDYRSVGKGKVVLFTGWRKDAEYLGDALRKHFTTTWVAHGEASQDEREDVRRAFMGHPGPCVLVTTWHSMGEGVNLDDADVIAYGMLPYTPRWVAQSEGRGDRLSMTRSLLYLYFVAAGTVDERIVDILLAKLKQVDAHAPGGRLQAHGGIAGVLSGEDDFDKLSAKTVAALLTAPEDDDARFGF